MYSGLLKVEFLERRKVQYYERQHEFPEVELAGSSSKSDVETFNSSTAVMVRNFTEAKCRPPRLVLRGAASPQELQFMMHCVCGHPFQQTEHQPDGMMVNPSRGQLNVRNGISPVPIRA